MAVEKSMKKSGKQKQKLSAKKSKHVKGPVRA